MLGWNKRTKLKAVKRLNAIDTVPWQQSLDLDNIWQQNANSVKEFQEINNRFPTHNSKNKEEKRLSYWVANQKKNYKGKAKELRPLTKEQISFLESIPGWYWDDDDLWQKNANSVKEFQENNKKHPSDHSKNKEEKRLGSWCSCQKKNYKGKGARPLTQEQISFLESIPGWKWEVDLDNIWQENANSVKEFQEKNKKYPSQKSKDLEEKRLGKWIANQKRNYKGKGTRLRPLTQERIYFLESLPNWFWNK